MPPEQVEGYFFKIFDECLERLQTDYVDIICLHDVHDTKYLQNKGLRNALARAKTEKKARSIGFSTHMNMAQCIGETANDGFYDVIVTAFNYAMNENKELISSMEKAAANGIGLIAMKTMCSQPWYKEQGNQRLYEGPILPAALLKWVLRHDFIATAIPGIQSFQELDENFSVAAGLEYTEEEKKFLQDRNVKLGMMSVCQQCYECMSTCPKGVDIPALIRSHMYATCYRNFHQARQTLDGILMGEGIDVCADCETCRAGCVKRVDIAGRIDELKAIYC